MLNPFLIFLLFFVASLAVRVIIMSYYTQYTNFGHLFSCFLIAIGTAFSIPFIVMKLISFPLTFSPYTKKWIEIGFIVLVFITTFLNSYYDYKPQI